MGDNLRVTKAVITKLDKTAGSSYSFNKYNDKNNNNICDKGELIGSIVINDYDGDGFDNHDGAVSNNFGLMPESLWETINKDNTANPTYHDASSVTANPATGKTYAEVKGTKSEKGLFTITSNKTEEFNLGSMAKQVIKKKDTAENNSNNNAGTTVNNQAFTNPYAMQMQMMGMGANIFGGGFDPSMATSNLKVDNAKLQAACSSGYANLSMALGGYGYGEYSGALAGMNAPQAAVKMFNDILAAFGGTTSTQSNNQTVTTNNNDSSKTAGANANNAAAGNISGQVPPLTGNNENATLTAEQLKAKKDAEAADKAKKDAEAAEKAKKDAEAAEAAKAGKNTGDKVITITKDKGLTQGLEDYAKVNKLINGTITKEQWNAAIAEFKTIEAEREKNKEKNIFAERSNANGEWHKHMVVKAGNISFSADEMNRLLKTIGATI